MSNFIEEDEDYGTYDIMYHKEIGENSELADKFCYAFAQRKLDALAEQFGITDQQLVFRGNIPTFTHILASMLNEYATQVFDDMDRVAGHAKQK